MPRKGDRKPETFAGDANDQESLGGRLREYIEWMRVHNYAETTVKKYRYAANGFTVWCHDRGMTRPSQITRSILERYQRWLYRNRDRRGNLMTFSNQNGRLTVLRLWFKWMAKQHYLETSPAAEITLPELPHRLPPVLSRSEMERVLSQADVTTRLGIRDRAILETFYSTGIRRSELIHLQVHDVDYERGTLLVRQGKGRKDRVVPIGERALAWIEKYMQAVRDRLCPNPEQERTLFVTKDGEVFSGTRMCVLVSRYLQASEVRKRGSCHLLRHTMATLMLENGADVRFIQAILGHVKLETTQVYTQVSIRKLQEIHRATHPAQMPGKSSKSQKTTDTGDGESD
jgi:integrase/recombinase XerD